MQCGGQPAARESDVVLSIVEPAKMNLRSPTISAAEPTDRARRQDPGAIFDAST